MLYGHIEMLKRWAKHADLEIALGAREDLATIRRLGLRELWTGWGRWLAEERQAQALIA